MYELHLIIKKLYNMVLEHIYISMGAKMCHIGNVNNLLCMNAFTYVVMLVMDKTKKTIEKFWWYGNDNFVTFLDYQDGNFFASELHVTIHLYIEIGAKFYY